MNENQWRVWSDEQRRIFIDAIQVFDEFRATRAELRRYEGGLSWKRAKGSEYLFKLSGRRGFGKSLGRRGRETELIHERFYQRKSELKARFARLQTRLKEQARFARAARLGGLGRKPAAILRELDRRALFERGLEVVGTHAMYAYEAMAGVRVEADVLATGDLDILWDDRVHLKAPTAYRKGGLIEALKKVDSTFELRRAHDFRAVNSEGFYVDLIRPENRDEIRRQRPDAIGDSDLEAAPIASQRWVVNAAPVRQSVIASDGYPVYLVAPDPRVFALHKLHISEQPEREAIKRQRDRHQAELVARLVEVHFPNHPFSDEALRMLPFDLRGRRDELLPDGFEL